MEHITDSYHYEKLRKKNINIKTKYIVDRNILERNNLYDKNDSFKNGIVYEKEYFLNDKSIHKETEFDSRIEYTYITIDEDKDFTCPNCGITMKTKDYNGCCPYCKTSLNIDFVDKDMGSKYHYDRVLKSNTYRIVTFIIDLIICITIGLIYIYNTSRTFNSYDIIKGIIIGIIASLVLYYIFYLLDAYLILGPIKRIKDKQNKKQKEFWKNTNLDKKKFYNNLNYELNKYYYSKDDLIDYDIIDYIKFDNYSKNNNTYIDITLEIRLINLINDKIESKIVKETFTLKHIDGNMINLNEGVNIIKCPGCGHSIDATKGKCSYCNKEIGILHEWIIER